MSKIFLTGDRSMSPLYPGMVIIEMFKLALQGHTLLTGENTGVEAIVRDVAHEVGLEVEVVPNAESWDERHSGLADDARVIAFHVDPMESRVVQSLFATLSEDRVELRSIVDLVS